MTGGAWAAGWDMLRRGAARAGRSPWAVLAEMLALRFGPTRLGLSEYIDFGLYDTGHFAPAGHRAFVGQRMERRLDRMLNDRRWLALTTDKLVFYALLGGLGVAYPRVHAVYHRGGRAFAAARTLRDPDALAAFLRDEIAYPFFAKGVEGSFGRRAALVRRLDRSRDQVILGSGEALSVTRFVRDWTSPDGLGWLFQACATQHPAIDAAFGGRVSTLRLIFLHMEGVTVLHRAVWKIAAGTAMVDNYLDGRVGNLLAAVDLESGRLTRAVTGLGLTLAQATHHPDTGTPLIGLTIPGWTALVERCRAVASGLPGLRFQHWDVAIGPDGPVVIEINHEGSLNLPQLAEGRGVLDERLSAALRTPQERAVSL